MESTYCLAQLDDIQRRCCRLERQNQALKMGLYFVLSAIRRLLIVVNPLSPDVHLCELHLGQLQALVPSPHAQVEGRQP